MSKNVAMFVDVANLYYAARGQDVDVDYVALLKAATKGRDLIRAYAYSGLDPENENQRKFIDFLGKNGYRVLTKDIRKFGDGRVKANLDIELVVDLFRLRDRMDVAVIVSGDGDFAPAIRALQDEGVRCEVISFKPNTSSDLMAVADEFVDIMKVASISRKKEGRAAGMSAPEMPAKEVTPEFGFREAPPSVAAAALAALRGGGTREGATGTATRGRGRRRTTAADEAVEEPRAVPATAAGVPGEDEPRRRRRRRGGRGRGRSRTAVTGEGAEALTPAGDGEVTWEEFDDLSQLDGIEAGAAEAPIEREYSFEEADEATLRELGMLGVSAAAPTPEAGPAGDAEDVPPAKPRRRTRGRSTAGAEVATDKAGAEEKPRRAPRTRKGSDAAPASTGAAAEEKPRRTTRAGSSSKASRAKADTAGTKPRSRSRKPAQSTEAPTGTEGGAGTGGGQEASGDEPQGIWGRFRSGRGSRD